MGALLVLFGSLTRGRHDSGVDSTPLQAQKSARKDMSLIMSLIVLLSRESKRVPGEICSAVVRRDKNLYKNFDQGSRHPWRGCQFILCEIKHEKFPHAGWVRKFFGLEADPKILKKVSLPNSC